MQKTKTKKIVPRNKVSLEILNHIFGHRSTKSLIDGDTANVWHTFNLR